MFFSVVTILVLRHYGITSQAPDIARFTEMQGNVPLYVSWLVMALLASPGEEIIYRGFMISRLEQVLGRSGFAIVLILLLQAGYFGIRHYYQGILQAWAAGTIGLVFGISYLLTKRNLWAVMIAHTFMNIMSLTGRFLG
jgi:membrane protease YdiL (CAAX protease family)